MSRLLNSSSRSQLKSIGAAACAAILLSGITVVAVAKEKAADDFERPVVYKSLRSGGHQHLVAKILIHARPEVVWDTVHEERKKDPDIAYAKVLSHEGHELILEEKFVLLPVIGTAKCIMRDVEVPQARIDYQLLESDHFKAMEGSWVLTAHDGGRSTILELSSYLELGMPVPRMVLDSVTSQKLLRRVDSIKKLAEKSEEHLAGRAGSI